MLSGYARSNNLNVRVLFELISSFSVIWLLASAFATVLHTHTRTLDSWAKKNFIHFMNSILYVVRQSYPYISNRTSSYLNHVPRFSSAGSAECTCYVWKNLIHTMFQDISLCILLEAKVVCNKIGNFSSLWDAAKNVSQFNFLVCLQFIRCG